MLKAIFIFIMQFFLQTVYAQERVFTKEEKAALDSMFREDPFFNLLKDALKPTSYVQLNMGIGNSYFSVKNKSVNAAQRENKLVYTPTVDFFHKSGFSLSAAVNVISFNGKTDLFQFSITPSFSVLNHDLYHANFNYTYYLHNKLYVDKASPLQHDLFFSGFLKKIRLQPGVAFGFSNGKSTQFKYIDTLFLGVRRTFTDTIKTNINNLTLSLSLKHRFEFTSVIGKDDAVIAEPKLMLNTGSNAYYERHFNPYKAFYNRILERRKSLGLLQEETAFGFQSLGLNLDVQYLTGKWALQPQLYLDYYLPDSSEKKITTFFSFVVSYVF